MIGSESPTLKADLDAWGDVRFLSLDQVVC